MVLVPNLQMPGYGGQAALPAGYRPSDFPAVDYTPSNGNGNGNGDGNGANGGTPAAPSFVIPDNFWGFVMLTMGLR